MSRSRSPSGSASRSSRCGRPAYASDASTSCAPSAMRRHRRGRVRRVGAASAIAFGAALFGFGVAAREPLAALAGPAVAAWGAVQLVGHLVARRVAISVAAAAVLAYLLAAFRLLPSVFGASGIEVFVE